CYQVLAARAKRRRRCLPHGRLRLRRALRGSLPLVAHVRCLLATELISASLCGFPPFPFAMLSVRMGHPGFVVMLANNRSLHFAVSLRETAPVEMTKK